MVTLREQRKKTIEKLVEWLKAQFPKILEELRSKEYWDNETYTHISFDQLPEYKQYVSMGQRVYETLKSHVRRNYMWSHQTEHSYIVNVLYSVGCVYKERRWFCRLQPQ